MATVIPVNISFMTENKPDQAGTEEVQRPESRESEYSKFVKRVSFVPSKARYEPQYERRIDDMLRIENPLMVQERRRIDSSLAEKILTTLSRKQREFEMRPSIRKKLGEEIRPTDRKGIKNIVIKHRESIKKLIEALPIAEELFEDEILDDEEDLTYSELREKLITSLLRPLETTKTSETQGIEVMEEVERGIVDEQKKIIRPISRKNRRERPSKKLKTEDISIMKRLPMKITSGVPIGGATHIQPWKSKVKEKKVTHLEKEEKSRIELDAKRFDENLEISKEKKPISHFVTTPILDESDFQNLPEPKTVDEKGTLDVDLNDYMREMYKKFVEKKIHLKNSSPEPKKWLDRKPLTSPSIKHKDEDSVALKSVTDQHPLLDRKPLTSPSIKRKDEDSVALKSVIDQHPLLDRKPRTSPSIKRTDDDSVALKSVTDQHPLLDRKPRTSPSIKRTDDDSVALKSVTDQQPLLDRKPRTSPSIKRTDDDSVALKSVTDQHPLLDRKPRTSPSIKLTDDDSVALKSVTDQHPLLDRKPRTSPSIKRTGGDSAALKSVTDQHPLYLRLTPKLMKPGSHDAVRHEGLKKFPSKLIHHHPVTTIKPKIEDILDEKKAIKRPISVTQKKTRRDRSSEESTTEVMKKSPKKQNIKLEEPVDEVKVQPWREEVVEKKAVPSKKEEEPEPRIEFIATSSDESLKSISEKDDRKKETLDFNLNDYLKKTMYELSTEKKVRPKTFSPVPKSVLKQTLRPPFVRRTDVNLFAYKSVHVEGPRLPYSELMRKQLELNLRLKTKLMELASQDAIPQRLQHQGLTKFPSKLIRYHVSETLQKVMKRPYTIASRVSVSQDGIEHIRALSDYWVQKLIPRTKRSVSVVRKDNFSEAGKMKKKSLDNYVVPAWRRQRKSFKQKTETVSIDANLHERGKVKMNLDAEKMKKRVLAIYFRPIETTRFRRRLPDKNILGNLKNKVASLEKSPKFVKKDKSKSWKKKVVLKPPEDKVKKCESVHNVLRGYFLKKNVTGKYLIVNLDDNEKNIDKIKLSIGEECELRKNWTVISFESVEEELRNLMEEDSTKGKQGIKQITGDYCIEFLKMHIAQKIANDFYAKHFTLGQKEDNGIFNEIIDKIKAKLDPLIRTFYEEYENVSKLLHSGPKRKPRTKLLLTFLLNSIVDELNTCIKSEEYLKQPQKIIGKVEIMMKEILQSFQVDYEKLLKKVNDVEAERKILILESFQCCLISKVTETLRPMFEKKRLGAFLENWQFQMQYIFTKVTNALVEEEPVFGLPLNDIDLYFSKGEDTSQSDTEAESAEETEKDKDKYTLFIEDIIHKCFEKVFIQKLTTKIREIFPSLFFGKPDLNNELMKRPDLRIETSFEDIRAQKGFLPKVKRRSNVDKEIFYEDSFGRKEQELIEKNKTIIESGLPDIVQRLVQKKRKKPKRKKKPITVGTLKDIKCVPVVNLELFKKDVRNLSQKTFYGSAEDLEKVLKLSATFSKKWLAKRLAIDLTVLIPYPESDMQAIIEDCSQSSKDILRDFLQNSSLRF